MVSVPTQREPVAIRLPLTYDVDLLVRDLEALRECDQSPQPGPYHDGEWVGLALRSMGGEQSTNPSTAGLGGYQYTEALERAPYFKQILDELSVPKEVVRILTLPPGGHIKDHFDFHTSFQYGLIRLHIPIVTHPDVEFVIGGETVDFKPGELWFGDFSQVHSVENKSPITRVHMVIDAQINDFMLGLFPADFVARRRSDGGIATTRDTIPISEHDVRRLACDFKIPGALLPLFVLGRPMQTLVKGAHASARYIDQQFTVLLDNEPTFVLHQVGENTFGVEGLPPGVTLRFNEDDVRVRSIDFELKGLPKDLYFARLGFPNGDTLTDRTITLPVIDS